jgi:hypothetical protein
MAIMNCVNMLGKKRAGEGRGSWAQGGGEAKELAIDRVDAEETLHRATAI